ncbi:hypothetical protein Bca4012_103032 [Brassica carinata]
MEGTTADRDTTVGAGALSSDTKMIQAGIQAVQMVGQRFKNSDWTVRTEGYGPAGRTAMEGRRPIGFLKQITHELSVDAHINTLALPVDYPWVILAQEDCPWVIFATRTVVSTHINALALPWTIRVILAHDDCPSMRISTRWPFRGLSGDFSPRGQYISTHINTLALSVDYPWPTRTVVGDFSLEDCPWVIFAHEDCRRCAYQHVGPSVDCRVIFAHDDYPSVCISTRWPFRGLSVGVNSPRGLSVGDFRHEDCRRCAYQHVGPSADCRVIFAHEDCPSMRISTRWPFRGLSGDFSPR